MTEKTIGELSISSVADSAADAKFGVAFLPGRVDDIETTSSPVSLDILSTKSAPLLKSYMEATRDGLQIPRTIHKYAPILWVIDEEGNLRYSLEEVVSNGDLRYAFPLAGGRRAPDGYSRLGHPSLVGGGKARIGGEIVFDPDLRGGTWVISNQSGRYGHSSDRKPDHLANVAALLKDHQIDIETDYRRLPAGANPSAI